jgi:hypothetical protein
MTWQLAEENPDQEEELAEEMLSGTGKRIFRPMIAL